MKTFNRISTWFRDTLADTLTFNEFCDICRREHATSEDDLIRAFRRVDVNGDGALDLVASNSLAVLDVTTVSVLPGSKGIGGSVFDAPRNFTAGIGSTPLRSAHHHARTL